MRIIVQLCRVIGCASYCIFSAVEAKFATNSFSPINDHSGCVAVASKSPAMPDSTRWFSQVNSLSFSKSGSGMSSHCTTPPDKRTFPKVSVVLSSNQVSKVSKVSKVSTQIKKVRNSCMSAQPGIAYKAYHRRSRHLLNRRRWHPSPPAHSPPTLRRRTGFQPLLAQFSASAMPGWSRGASHSGYPAVVISNASQHGRLGIQ
jgi:hypothetical protein